MEWDLYQRLIQELDAPRRIILNYSGESVCYPRLPAAIRLAAERGAAVELVTALAPAPPPLLEELATCGLARLTISVHAADPGRLEEIYGVAPARALPEKVARLVAACRGSARPPIVDAAFVAMQRNLDQLPRVSEWAAQAGLERVVVFPILRRDEIPERFDAEIVPGDGYAGAFRAALTRMLAQCSGAPVSVADASFNGDGGAQLGPHPRPWPGPLPVGARIHSCEQNPWETAHVLANGDVVPCEVHDRLALGNLSQTPLREVWNGAPYRRFRADYAAGRLEACRRCPWKMAYRPADATSRIDATQGAHAQLGYGWHGADGEPHLWSAPRAGAWLRAPEGARRLCIAGALPPAGDGRVNRLDVSVNGKRTRLAENASGEVLPFAAEIGVAAREESWQIEFAASEPFRPRSQGAGADERVLGFALQLLAAETPLLAGRTRLAQLRRAARVADALGRALPRLCPAPQTPGSWRPGVTVLIPERGTPDELARSLRSTMTEALPEPLQVIVVVNGAEAGRYAALQRAFPAVEWSFHGAPLGFSRAVDRGLKHVRSDWVYLLNSDAEMRPGALAAALEHRAAGVFAVASRIHLRGADQRTEETNYNRLLREDGLATIHDIDPPARGVRDHAYAGGGSSLFCTLELRRFLAPGVYDPFYWEDVEWAWRARRCGLRVLFAAGSAVWHTRRATLHEYYLSEEIELVTRRNRLLFQLRNWLGADDTERAVAAVLAAPAPVREYFASPAAWLAVAAGRLWNWRHAATR